MRALIVALNPSIDVEWRVDRIRWEEKNIVHAEHRWPGGKGVNVARWLKYLGGQPLLLLPLGGPTGREMAGGLKREKLPTRIIPLHEPTRANIIISAASGGQMRFNPVGPRLSRREWNQILQCVHRSLKSCSRTEPTPDPSRKRKNPERTRLQFPSWEESGVGLPGSLLILSGSLPRGVPATAYARLIRLARRAGVRTLLDCDGPVLAAAIQARPFLVKPNEHELAEWWGSPLRSERDLVHAARALSKKTRGWILVSRGAKRGLLINQEEGYLGRATPPRVKPRNTVGAGDALLAAVARSIQAGAGPEEWLHSGVTTGAAATQCVAGKLPRVRP